MKIRDDIAPYFEKGKKYAAMGVGSELRNDDAAGMIFASELESLIQSDNLLVIGGGSAPENFTGVIKDFKPDILFIVDAAFMGHETGEISLLDSKHIEGISFSTHMLPLPLMLDYLKTEAGCETVIIGIQPENTGQGLEVCEKVETAAKELAKVFASLIK